MSRVGQVPSEIFQSPGLHIPLVTVSNVSSQIVAVVYIFRKGVDEPQFVSLFVLLVLLVLFCFVGWLVGLVVENG